MNWQTGKNMAWRPFGCPAKFVSAITLALLLGDARTSSAQLIRSSSPFTTVNSSFYERLGIDFGFSIGGTRVPNINDRTRGVFGYGPGGIQPNITFSQGGVNSAVPAYGGYDPNADATFGYQSRNGGSGYHLGLRFGKGSNRSITNTTPTVVTRNGATGSIVSGSVSPFVTGIVPVVGRGSGYAVPGPITYTNPLEMKLRQMHLEQSARKYQSPQNRTTQNQARYVPKGSQVSTSSPAPGRKPVNRGFGNPESTALRGDISVKEIKRLRALEREAKAATQNAKAEEYLAKSVKALSDGNEGAARSYMRNAVRFSTGSRKAELQKRLDALIMGK